MNFVEAHQCQDESVTWTNSLSDSGVECWGSDEQSRSDRYIRAGSQRVSARVYCGTARFHHFPSIRIRYGFSHRNPRSVGYNGELRVQDRSWDWLVRRTATMTWMGSWNI